MEQEPYPLSEQASDPPSLPASDPLPAPPRLFLLKRDPRAPTSWTLGLDLDGWPREQRSPEEAPYRRPGNKPLFFFFGILPRWNYTSFYGLPLMSTCFLIKV